MSLTSNKDLPEDRAATMHNVSVISCERRAWQLEYRHNTEPRLALRRSNGHYLRQWHCHQAMAILSHPQAQQLLCLPSLCHDRRLALSKAQAQSLLLIATCCRLLAADTWNTWESSE